MYAQCPECLSLYELDAATLAQAHGTVGCGQCGATFNALATLAESWPETPAESLPVHPASPAPPILMMPATPPASSFPANDETGQPADPVPAAPGDAPAGAPLATTNETPATMAEATTPEAARDSLADFMQYLQAATPEAATTAEEAPGMPPSAQDDEAEEATANRDLSDPVDPVADAEETPTATPSFARHRRRVTVRPLHRRRWAVGCLLLALCLGAQLVWAERQALAANPATRPWLATACGWLGCRLPTVRDLPDLELLSRDVRPHPSVPGALLISATVRNNAPFAQPYPVVSITLSDLDENRIAMRRFRPSVYLPDAQAREAGLAPGATTALMFEVRDPGRNAIAFEFAFQ